MVAVVLVFVFAAAVVAFLALVVPRLHNDLGAAALALPGLCTDDGLGTAQVAAGIADDEAAAQRTLRKLAAGGYVEQVPGSRPARWRLTPACRSLIKQPDVRRRRP
jgi:hypothetical protein